MSRQRYTPEQIIGKLREAEVALSAIYSRPHSNQPIVDIRFLSSIRLSSHQGLQLLLAHGIVTPGGRSSGPSRGAR